MTEAYLRGAPLLADDCVCHDCFSDACCTGECFFEDTCKGDTFTGDCLSEGGLTLSVSCLPRTPSFKLKFAAAASTLFETFTFLMSLDEDCYSV